MASHHHHQNHHCHPTAAAATYCCRSYSTCCNPQPPDPLLLQSLASQIHHPPPPPYLHYSPYLNPPYDPQIHHHHHHPPVHPPPTHQEKHHQDAVPESTVSSLLRRIAALESSLRRRQFFPNSTTSFSSLRNAAARTIQTHFRAFLVRRSRTLRQLKDLASIKSALITLKSAISDNTHLDPQVLSRRAMDLLLNLDSIQGGDPMIRDGKRSITRELIRFLEFIDGVSVRRNKVSNIGLKNVRFGGTGNKSRVLYSGQNIGTVDFVSSARDEIESVEKQRNRVRKIYGISRVNEEDGEEGIELENPRISINGKSGGLVRRHGGDQAKVKKSVSFAENGNVSRVFITTHEPNSNEGVIGIDDEGELVGNLCREVEEIGGFSKGSEDDEEADSKPQTSDDVERIPRRNLGDEDQYEVSGHYESDNDKFAFPVPLRVKLESRTIW